MVSRTCEGDILPLVFNYRFIQPKNGQLGSVGNGRSEIYRADLQKAVLNKKVQGAPIALHWDNGSLMIAPTFQVFLEKMGIQNS
ncbi:hypothetical protein ACH0B6_00950 [Solibacillus silvestris]